MGALKMKALVKKYPQKGLWFEEVPEPQIGPNDVKIKIHKMIFFIFTSIKTRRGAILLLPKQTYLTLFFSVS